MVAPALLARRGARGDDEIRAVVTHGPRLPVAASRESDAVVVDV
jgi:hypothetical protein